VPLCHARLDVPGILQHVMARGIERRKIFWDDKDCSSFLERLAIILEETQTQCYAWVLIPIHFHLLLRTGPTSLSTVMRRLMTPDMPLHSINVIRETVVNSN
jgi:putative transposase